MGVNTDLAPVVDVNTNPLNQSDGARSYSDRTSVANSFTTQQVKGLQQNKTTGVAATAKHFPGLGSVTENTDVQPGASDRTLAQLKSIDLPPFAKAVKAGTRQVMTNFATYPKADASGLPAALSDAIVRGMLRDSLHFRGVVITDALQAGRSRPSSCPPPRSRSWPSRPATTSFSSSPRARQPTWTLPTTASSTPPSGASST